MKLMTRENPCHHCQDRYPACSGHCQKEDFLNWREAERARKEAMRREKELWGYTADQIRKNRRVR